MPRLSPRWHTDEAMQGGTTTVPHGIVDRVTLRPTHEEEDQTMHQQEFQPLDSAVIPRFAEPATFMRTPYVPSYAGLDIALVGVPFDLGSTNRAGARHGPAQIREMSRLI